MGHDPNSYPKKVHTTCSLKPDKLAACYRVKHFIARLYCRNRRVQRLLDDKEARGGPSTLPQPYTLESPPKANDTADSCKFCRLMCIFLRMLIR
ncbi:hypothetical protein CIPAW_16G114400 [Carya illinoinensis]|uniref:Uncharacterized protein n=1 Tax=Carya illinoinensis TaxID=32201 RepID=A0A8T1N312_CARIL|nr:hypothetical protein CIPAW_16G114400 [Carya illinoinensis]